MSMTAMDTAVLWSMDFDPELPCEYTHRETECSKIATHFLDCCRRELICQNAAARIEGVVSIATCGVCFRPVKNHCVLTRL